MDGNFPSTLSAEALQGLRAAGWNPSRSVDVSHWEKRLGAQGLVLHSIARIVLGSLGGLTLVPPVGIGAFRNGVVLFDPVLAGDGMFDVALELKGMFGQDFYPIAEWITNSTLFLGSGGIVLDDHDVDLRYVADTFEDALDMILFASRALPVLKVY